MTVRASYAGIDGPPAVEPSPAELFEAARRAVLGITLDQAVTQLEHALWTVLARTPC